MIINSELYIFGFGFFLLFLFIYPKIDKTFIYEKSNKRSFIIFLLFLNGPIHYSFAFDEGNFIDLLFIDKELILFSIFYLLFGWYLVMFKYWKY